VINAARDMVLLLVVGWDTLTDTYRRAVGFRPRRMCSAWVSLRYLVIATRTRMRVASRLCDRLSGGLTRERLAFSGGRVYLKESATLVICLSGVVLKEERDICFVFQVLWCF
jgi:hypothetical protein